jgi:hypothetical protein
VHWQSPTSTTPFCDVDWINRRTIEVFYVGEDWAREFGGSVGWYWWKMLSRVLVGWRHALGSFPTSHRAYKDALTRAL